MRCKKPSPLVTLFVSALIVTLTACASLTGTKENGIPTSLDEERGRVCLMFKTITVNRGKPGGATVEDMASMLDRDSPVKRMRNLIGDTDKTLAQIEEHNAAVRCYCEDKCNVASAR